MRCFAKQCLLLLMSILLLVIYNEVYLYVQRAWKVLQCEGKCLSVLLVADPQLIGLRNEVVHQVTPVSIWDSDRYLSKTYNFALQHSKPDIVIFLGDLFDEGTIASDAEYASYVHRFRSIFKVKDTPSSNIKHIFVPGDNDIGGEAGERVTTNNVRRFEQAFPQETAIAVGNVTFYKINRLTKSIPDVDGEQDFFSTVRIRVGVSHMPLMFMPSFYVDQVFKSLQPHLMFTGHEHKSMILSTDGLIQKDRQIIPVTEEENKVYNFELGTRDMYEIIVPTCSYRMGTTKIGYGHAMIGETEFHYTVLWSPSRFKQLILYGILLILLVLYILILGCRRLRCRRNSMYSNLNNNKC